ncbi:GntR family transcriptional regulator [Mahella australiensis]|uniref:Transcriptional regulator, GntR family with LacI sensor n=1 Tax=Mahella australiensis (strain DSM 15567 / CIP 107919 / 50-1 BON) TaxID=697281 RepID=F4A3E3_MAHA5|nr:GntR family transcriptional regulator [Mahella australiensis]AEE97398.1 transcriptional regulator, GntR family with LacI sensor [Mahella australiensis 50-1 BON]
MMPKYMMVKQYLKEKIDRGEIKKGERIESENELAKRFNVSNITIRRALSDLSNEGYIYRVQGKGSFACEVKSDIPEKGMHVIAVIFSLIRYYNDIFIDMIKGIQSYLEENHYSMVMYYYESDPDKERQKIHDLITGNEVEGLILYSYMPEHNIALFKEMKTRKFPFVLLDRYCERYPTNYVMSDGFSGAYGATEYLINLGHKDIAFVSSELDVSTVKRRIEGYINALKNNDTACEGLVFNNDESSLNEIMNRAEKGDITAVITGNKSTAAQLVYMLYQRGLSVPQDMSLITFDGSPELPLSSKLRLTCIEQPYYEMGRKAAAMLLDDIRDPKIVNQSIILPCRFVEGNSCNKLSE